jgi:hypothetical protein
MRHLDDGILQAWLDGPRSGLSAAERDEIERHLSSCDACARRLEALDDTSRRVETLLSGPEAAGEPVPAFDAVLARAHRGGPSGRSGPTRRARSRWAAAAWAASVAAAVGVGWLGSEIYRGGARTPAEAARVDSAPATQQMAAAQAAPDTHPQGDTTRAAEPSPTSPTELATPAVETKQATPVVVLRPAAPVLERPAPPTVAAAKAAGVPDHVRDAPTMRAGSVPAFVRGRVTDESGQPLAAAQVVVKGTGVGTLTRGDGSFELSLDKVSADSAPREVTLTAQLMGYRNESRSLALRGGKLSSADFRLAPEAVSLSEIVVTGVAASKAGANAAARSIVVPPDDAEWGSWRSVTRERAEAEAGFRLLTVPDLLVERIDVRSASGVVLVRVVQGLAEGGSLELVEAPDTVRFGGPTPSGGRAHASMRRGDVFIAATAPLSAAALGALLDRLR